MRKFTFVRPLPEKVRIVRYRLLGHRVTIVNQRFIVRTTPWLEGARYKGMRVRRVPATYYRSGVLCATVFTEGLLDDPQALWLDQDDRLRADLMDLGYDALSFHAAVLVDVAQPYLFGGSEHTARTMTGVAVAFPRLTRQLPGVPMDAGHMVLKYQGWHKHQRPNYRVLTATQAVGGKVGRLWYHLTVTLRGRLSLAGYDAGSFGAAVLTHYHGAHKDLGLPVFVYLQEHHGDLYLISPGETKAAAVRHITHLGDHRKAVG